MSLYTTYTNPAEKRTVWTSTWTQRLANELPEFMVARRDASSVGQELLNSIAQNLQIAESDLSRARFEQYLSTTSNDQHDIHYRFILPEGQNLTPPDEVNLIRNSSFEIRTDQAWFSDWWDWDGNGTVSIVSGLRTEKALSVLNGKVAQELQRSFAPGHRLTLSGWYKVAASGSQVELTVTYSDATTQTWSTNLAVSSNWSKFSLTSSAFSKRVDLIHIVITGGASALSVDNLQLERGAESSRWVPNIEDRYFWIEDTEPCPISLLSPTYCQYMGQSDSPEVEYEWWRAHPTRATLASTQTKAPFSVPSDQTLGYQYDFYKRRWLEAWRISSNKIQRYGPEAGDIYANYDLWFPTLEGQYYADTYTLEALTVFRDVGWVVYTRSNWAGVTKRYLGIFSPNVPRSTSLESTTPQSSYLEILTAIELPVNSAVNRMAFFQDFSEALYLHDGTDEYVVRLYYDYILINFEQESVYTRHRYTNAVPYFVNPVRRS